MGTEKNVVISARNLSKAWTQNVALSEISFDIRQGEIVSLIGPGYSGRLTLQKLLAGNTPVSSGELIVQGRSFSKATEEELSQYRRNGIAAVWQCSIQRISDWTLLENIFFQLECQPGVNFSRLDAQARAREMLENHGIAEYANRRIEECPQDVRLKFVVACASSTLVDHPPIVVAHHPTANLKGYEAAALMLWMQQERETYGTTFVINSDRVGSVKYADRVIELHLGTVVADKTVAPGVNIEEQLHPCWGGVSFFKDTDASIPKYDAFGGIVREDDK